MKEIVIQNKHGITLHTENSLVKDDIRISVDEKILSSGTAISTAIAKTYTIPLGEASWLRIAKVIDTSKIASGIFTFNSYGVKEDGTKDTLNAVTFSINSGIDRTKQVYGDVLPLSVSPEMSGSSSSDGSVDTPSSASIVAEEENTPAVASEDEILAVSSDVPSSSVGGSGGSGSGNSFGLTTVTVEEYEQDIYICGLVSFPNVEYYKSFEVELILENNSNYEPLEILEKVDFTMIDSKGQMPVLEGITLEEGKNYNFILKGNLGTYIDNATNKKPLKIDLAFENDSSNLITYLVSITKTGFTFSQWGQHSDFIRDENLDTVINGTQYYGYKTETPLPSTNVTELLVTDDPINSYSTLYRTNGDVYEYSGEIWNIISGGQEEIQCIINNEIIYNSMLFGAVLFNNLENAITGINTSLFSQSGEQLYNLSEDIKRVLDKSKNQFDYTTVVKIPEKIDLTLYYRYGSSENSNPNIVLLNDETIGELGSEKRELIIKDFVYGKDKLEVNIPEGNYIGGEVYCSLENVQYEIKIPYNVTKNRNILEYLIADNNPYGISLMVEETVKHNVIDKYNMHSIYKQIDKVDDDISYLRNITGRIDNDVYNIKQKLETTSSLEKITYTLSENFLTDAQKVVLALNRTYLDYGTFSRGESYNFILILTNTYDGKTPYIVYLNLYYYGGEEIEFIPLFGDNLGKKYVLNQNQIYFDNYLSSSDITDDMFTISGSEIGGGVTEEYVNQAIANAITNVLEAEY